MSRVNHVLAGVRRIAAVEFRDHVMRFDLAQRVLNVETGFSPGEGDRLEFLLQSLFLERGEIQPGGLAKLRRFIVGEPTLHGNALRIVVRTLDREVLTAPAVDNNGERIPRQRSFVMIITAAAPFSAAISYL